MTMTKWVTTKWATAAVLGCSMVVAGCGDDNRSATLETPARVTGDENVVRPATIQVEGCVTGRDGRFVLTELTRGASSATGTSGQAAPAPAPEPTTESYRLIAPDEQLRPHVGQRVEIVGAAEPERVVEVREVSPPRDTNAAPSSAPNGPTPQTETVQSTRLEVADLRVMTIDPSGVSCRTAS